MQQHMKNRGGLLGNIAMRNRQKWQYYTSEPNLFDSTALFMSLNIFIQNFSDMQHKLDIKYI